MFVKEGQTLEGVVYKTQEIIVQKIQEGTERKVLWLIGDGHSLSVDENNRIIKCDPAMMLFKPKVNRKYTVYAWYFTFECTGLKPASQDLVNFLNLLDRFKKFAVIGHSKCGFCSALVKQQCDYVTAIAISTPWNGTHMADAAMIRDVNNNPLVLKIHGMIFSEHNVDKDISPKSELVKGNYFVDINLVSRWNGFRNCRNPVDAFLFFWDDILDVDGDGIVPFNSQQDVEFAETKVFYCSHASSLAKGSKLLNKLL